MERFPSSPGDVIRVTKQELQNNKVIRASEAPALVRESILLHSEQLKQRALDILPDHEGGAETARIDAFFEREGLKPKPAKVLTPQELFIYRDELAKFGYHDDRLDKLGERNEYDGANVALYMPQLSLIVAVKWLEYQGDEAATQFQAILAHEKAHSTTEFNSISYTQTNHARNYAAPRVGQTLYQTGRGIFLEEGFADYMAAHFVRKELHLPNGAWQTSDNLKLGDRDPVPPVYIWPNVEHRGDATMTIGAFAAYGLELINQKDSRLHSALIQGRKSAEGLRQVAQIIEGIRPGLYTELQKLGESPDEFARGLRAIQAAIA